MRINSILKIKMIYWLVLLSTYIYHFIFYVSFSSLAFYSDMTNIISSYSNTDMSEHSCAYDIVVADSLVSFFWISCRSNSIKLNRVSFCSCIIRLSTAFISSMSYRIY